MSESSDERQLRLYVKDVDGERLLQTFGSRLEADLDLAERAGLDGVACHPDDLPKVASRRFRTVAVAVDDRGVDLGPLSGMTWLKGLRLAGHQPAAVDLTGLESLEHLTLTWRRGCKLPRTAPNLKRLQITDYKSRSRDLKALNAPRLLELRLYGGTLRSLDGIQGSTTLRLLHLTDLAELVDVSALGSLGSLEELWVLNASDLRDLSPVQQCEGLRRLRLDECPEVESLRWVSTLPQLEHAVLLASGERLALEIAEVRKSTNAVVEPDEVPGGAGMGGLRVDIETDDADVVVAWRTRLPDLIAAARQRLANDPGESGLLYAEHHIAEIEPEAWGALHGLEKPPSVAELLRLLEPVSLWGDPTEGLHLDFSIGEDLTQYVLSFEVRPDGTLGDIDMES